MNDPRTTREIAIGNEKQIGRIWAEIEDIKAQLRLLEQERGWDPDALEFPADVPKP